jgi:decaprenylphospho-beta-D-ribofuranose 2-oxidase
VGIWATQELAGWGRYPIVETSVLRAERRSELFRAIEEREQQPLLAHGLGRSYGDAALLRNGKVVLTRRLDRMLSFDPSTGWLRCEAGVTVEDIVKTFLPRGFFPPVVPGTQFVTAGGALACNIHGKNHHVDGCWGDHVRNVELLLGSGEVVLCDREQNPELFWATTGGMGLTGLILAMDVRLYEIESPLIEMESVRVECLDDFFEVSKASAGFTHTVSWIDCVKTGKSMGRGIFMRGRHANATAQRGPSPLEPLIELGGKLVDGRWFESDHLLNRAFMVLFNETYFRKQRPGTSRSISAIQPFFFPLDAVRNWNYAYGKRGFLQYQLVVPPDPEHRVLTEVLERISASGMASFLAVIKDFGPRVHGGLSFPVPGTTLALDIPNHGPALLSMLDALDELVADAGGRIYLGKDARLSRRLFEKMYPELDAWREVRDRWDPQHVFQSELGRRLGLS